MTGKIFTGSSIILMILLLLAGCTYNKEEIIYPPSACNTANVTYALTVQPIIPGSCYGCHNTANAALSGGGNMLDSHQKLKVFADNGKLAGVIMHSPGYTPMPKNSAKLNTCDIEKIKAWIAAGAPNN